MKSNILQYTLKEHIGITLGFMIKCFKKWYKMNKEMKKQYRKQADDIINSGYANEVINDLYNLIDEILSNE
jgi:phosphopantothenate synthetase